MINELILSTESKKLKLRKNVNSRTRSPASQSPASKSRKAAAAAATVTTSGKPRLDLSFSTVVTVPCKALLNRPYIGETGDIYEANNLNCKVSNFT